MQHYGNAMRTRVALFMVVAAVSDARDANVRLSGNLS
jgi:hypothetical protein